MYTDIRTILQDAVINNYAVLAGVPINMEMIRGMIAGANEKKAPLILLFGQNASLKHATGELLIPLVKKIAEKTPIPIAVMLDHGSTYERITYAFRHGYSSIMIDASDYILKENIHKTQEVIKLCHMHGIAVEAEVGHVGMAQKSNDKEDILLTDPNDAKVFVEQTNVDCLAVLVGTAHGEYPRGYIPQINHDRICEIKEKVGKTPLALHGASGSSEIDIVKAVECGINKINVGTEFLNGARDFIKQQLMLNKEIDFISLMSEMERYIKKITMEWIGLTGSSGKANNFKPQDTLYTVLGRDTNMAGE